MIEKCAIVTVLALTLDLEYLAVGTSILTLIIFAAVNAALLRVKYIRLTAPENTFIVPAIFPVLGILSIAGIAVAMLGYAPGLSP
jgi:hypothetical protein